MKKNILVNFKVLFVISVVVISAGCSNDGNMSSKGEQLSSENNEPADSTHKDDIKIYTLPAPLQVPTALKNLNLSFAENILAPTNQSTATFPTNFLKALNIGVFGIDMGYSAIYEKHQAAIYYLSKIQKLSDELGIIGGFQPSTVERFKNNTKNQDSLYYIILETFNNCHKYLKENDRNDIGLLIITGSYMEGMYIATAKGLQNNNDIRIMNLIARQQVFLDNLIELLNAYNNDKDIAGLIADMESLKENYKGVSVKEENLSVSSYENKAEITTEQLKTIAKKISEIRNKITG